MSEQRKKYDPINIYALYDRTAMKVITIMSFTNDQTAIVNVKKQMEQAGITADEVNLYRLATVDGYNPLDVITDTDLVEIE